MSEGKLEFPRDIGRKVLSMLKPKAKPFCVLIFEVDTRGESCEISWKTDSLSDEDRDFILELDYARLWGGYETESTILSWRLDIPDKEVHRALMLGFRFQDDASRTRWKNKKRCCAWH
jgi:hypothetical protein